MEFIDYLNIHFDKKTVENILNSFEEERTSCLILNYNKFTKDILKDVELFPHPYVKNAFYFDRNKFRLGNDFRFDNGVYYIQDASSMMVTNFLGIKENDFVLDMCAAPGGKTIDVALKLNNSGSIIANDLSYERARTLSSNIEKMGFCNVFVTNSDFRSIYQHYLNTFDKIILDAPCSGSFMFRKNNLSKIDWSYEKVQSCSKTQTNLINCAAFMLKDGGRISYSTCSLSKEENEDIIINFLKTHQNFKTIKIDLGKDVLESKYLQNSYYLMPYQFKGEGQFFCILEKSGSSSSSKYLPQRKMSFTSLGKLYCDYFNNEITVNDMHFLCNIPAELKYLKVLRYGLLLSSTKGNIEIPSFHLAHYLPNINTIELTKDELKQYLHGEELSKQWDNGFFIASYETINLGYVKVSNNKLKNYYPKGLRK